MLPGHEADDAAPRVAAGRHLLPFSFNLPSALPSGASYGPATVKYEVSVRCLACVSRHFLSAALAGAALPDTLEDMSELQVWQQCPFTTQQALEPVEASMGGVRVTLGQRLHFAGSMLSFRVSSPTLSPGTEASLQIFVCTALTPGGCLQSGGQ